MKTTKELETLLLSTGVVTEEMKTKLCIIEDIVKFTTSKGFRTPTESEMKSLMNMPLDRVEEFSTHLAKSWNEYEEFRAELRGVIKLMEILTLMKGRGK